MKSVEGAPSESPTAEQQQQALKQGLGRAMQWARRGNLDKSLLLKACLSDGRYDKQTELSRGPWLWRLITASGADKHIEMPLLDALRHLSSDSDGPQLLDLASAYAQAGSEQFREELNRIARERGSEFLQYYAQKKLLQLDELPALLSIAQQRGEELQGRDWNSDDDLIIGFACKQFGDQAVRKLFAESGSLAVTRFADGWQHAESRPPECMESFPVDDIASLTLDEIMRTSPVEGAQGFRLTRWGVRASLPELSAIARKLMRSDDPVVLKTLLRVFASRPLPEIDPRMIDLCRHPDAELRERAIRALGENRDSRIREFALGELDRGTGGDLIRLLVRNFQREDEHRICDGLSLPHHEDERHRVLSDIVDLLEQNPESACLRLALAVYASTPCSVCRAHVVQLLQKQGEVPDWLAEEFQDDVWHDA
ncbi:HEAT repeat domain-containing protein [Planctomicrobium sp. SH664]|uniref:HEAT repeat domain-containing protein n=1 Tax=Planctomicrobium sp. SH664 TaxID=3448125 RepID=UPI003F5CB041